MPEGDKMGSTEGGDTGPGATIAHSTTEKFRKTETFHGNQMKYANFAETKHKRPKAKKAALRNPLASQRRQEDFPEHKMYT